MCLLFKIQESVLKYVTALAKTSTTEKQKKKERGQRRREDRILSRGLPTVI